MKENASNGSHTSTSIPAAVGKILEESRELHTALGLRLINYSALARHIRPKIVHMTGRAGITDHALTMAVRRTAKRKFKQEETKCAQFIAQTTLTLQPAMAAILVKNNPNMLARMTGFLSDKEHWISGERNYLIWTNEGIFAAANKEKIARLEKIAGKKNVKWREPELALLRMHHPHNPPAACVGKMLQSVYNKAEIVGVLTWPGSTTVFLKEDTLPNAYARLANEIGFAKRIGENASKQKSD